jgi:4-amino-4-deoxy-L-arabinose transferase-like glycosyltransferase
MINNIISISILIIIAILYWQAFVLFNKNETKKAVFLLIVGGFALRFFCSTDAYLHIWDERYHALVAKHILDHLMVPTLYTKPVLTYDPADWTHNFYWVHKQPIPLYSIALSYKIFGINHIALRLPSIILSTIGIAIVYQLGVFAFQKKVGFLAAFFFSINGLLVEISSGRVATDHIDVFFLFFISLAVLLSFYTIHFKNNIFNILVGISIGCAILVKWLPAFIVLPIWFLILWQSKLYTFKQLFWQGCMIFLVACIIFIPWQLYIYHTWPLEAAAETEYNKRHIFELLANVGGPWYYFLNQLRINYGELIYAPIIWFIYKSYQSKTNFTRWALLLWFVIPFVFFSCIATKMQAYILFTCPVLFLITAELYYDFQHFKILENYPWIKKVLMVLFIALPIRYALERIKPLQDVSTPDFVSSLGKLKNITDSNTVLFHYNKPIEAMYYTNIAAAYEKLPTQKTVDSLLANHYNIVIPAADSIYLKRCRPLVFTQDAID